ncbi:hypothetical protein GCM10022239_20840 [Leifsonia bigeumensis]|uniref:Uncharacterized protein n=1 Tax=Leifsonella bigeumensis TaxID=433643 RepID=A0ABP7FPI3_9MICO
MTAPAAHSTSHQPRTKMHRMTHTRRMPIVTLYLIILERRSSSGDRGSDVMEFGCFAMGSLPA